MDTYESIPSIHRIFQIFSLSQITIDRRSGRMHINLRWQLWSLATTCVSLGFAGYLVLFAYDWEQVFFAIHLTTAHFMHIASYAESFLRSGQNIKVFEKMRAIDASFRRLLTRKELNARRVRRQVIVYSWMLLLAHLFSVGFFFFELTYNGNDTVYYVPASSYHLAMAITSLKCYQILLVIYQIKLYFERLNTCLEAAARLPTLARHRKLKQLQRIYDQLHELVGMVCDLYGVMLLLNVPIDIYTMTMQIYWTIFEIRIMMPHSFEFLNVLSWSCNFFYAFPNLFHFFLLMWLCQVIIDTSTRFGTLIQTCFMHLELGSHASLIETISLQMIHKPIRFSIYGIFEINSALIFTLATSFSSFLVIIIDIRGLPGWE